MFIDLSRISSIGDALRDAVVPYKSNVALIEANRDREVARYSYLEFGAAAERIGTVLQDNGFEPGQRCAILMTNQSKWLIGATGALWAGATLVPLDYKLTPPEQLALLAHCKPRVLITEYSVWKKFESQPEPGDFSKTLVLVTEAPDGADLGGAVRFEADPKDGAEFTYFKANRDDVACIVYSSGTGGQAKGCQLTHGNYLAQAEVLARLYPMAERDRYFSILPTNHAIDFMCGFFIPLIMGSAVVHQRTLRPQFLASTMKRYRVTHMALVPMLLKTLETRLRDALDELPSWQRSVIDGLMSVNEAATRREPNHALSKTLLKPIHDRFGGHLKFIFCGGAFVDRKSAEFFYKIGIPVAIGYGLTEAGTVLTVNNLKPFRGDTVGTAVEGTTIELRNVNDAGVGEVWAQGPTIMKGYLDEPDLTAETIIDGWLKTGDLGTMDVAGHLKLVGRAKNMIVTEGGKNIYPEDIEKAFEDIEGVEEFCVFAANYIWPTGSMVDEKLTLVVRPEKTLGPDETLGDDILDQIRRRNRKLVDYKRISSYVEWRDEFTRTASLKVKRAVLASDIAASGGRDPVLKEL